MIEATIMRDSWPSNESAWSFINMLKNVEKLEDGMQVYYYYCVIAVVLSTSAMTGHAGADKPPSGRRQTKPKGPKTGGGGGRGSVMQHRQVETTITIL